MGHRTSLLSVMEVDGPLMQVTTAAPSPADRGFTTPFPVLQLLTSAPPPLASFRSLSLGKGITMSCKAQHSTLSIMSLCFEQCSLQTDMSLAKAK